jgi:hypothetical protein
MNIGGGFVPLTRGRRGVLGTPGTPLPQYTAALPLVASDRDWYQSSELRTRFIPPEAQRGAK